MRLELEKLHVIEDQNRNLKELERTNRQKDILRHLSPRDVIEHLERISRLKIG